MAETPEGKIKRKIKDMLHEHGADVYYFMPAMGQFGKMGVPDIIACVNGFFLAIEVKADMHKNKPTMLQRRNMMDILTANGTALVIDEKRLPFFKDYLNMLMGGKHERRNISSSTNEVFVPRSKKSIKSSKRIRISTDNNS
ncbi:MAG TPA: hypothetical protein PLQ34_07740 [Ferrovaceae bacterium]|jgi:hypothetical protein|nr:hypothetical protein [Ferrovaceae bacterium]